MLHGTRLLETLGDAASQTIQQLETLGDAATQKFHKFYALLQGYKYVYDITVEGDQWGRGTSDARSNLLCMKTK